MLQSNAFKQAMLASQIINQMLRHCISKSFIHNTKIKSKQMCNSKSFLNNIIILTIVMQGNTYISNMVPHIQG